MKTVLPVFTVPDLENIRQTLLEDGEVMMKLRDRLKDESLPVEEQNELRKQVIDLLAKDLLLSLPLT